MKKKKIAIVALGYAWLPGEKGPSRFYYLANMFAEAGYEVELIGSDFQHFEKRPRNIETLNQKIYRFKNVFIHVPCYKANIDFRRIWSNWIAARNLIVYLKKQSVYDVVYCAIPANNVAAAVSIFCKQKRIPFVVDIEDLWPEAMRMVFNLPVISDFFYYPMLRAAETTYQNADAIIGTSEDYTQRAFLRRKKNIPAKTIYVGCDLEEFDASANEYISMIDKIAGEFWVSYAGSIGTSYDIKTLILAAKKIEEAGYKNIKFLIMGTGPLLQDMQILAGKLDCNNVIFLGYVEYGKMAAYLKRSDIVVNSFIKGAPQSIVNKIGDYLASESAMINTLENPVFMELVERQEFGVNIEAENIKCLVDTVTDLYKDSILLEKLSKNARKCAYEQFDRSNSYKKIIDIVDDVIKKKVYLRDIKME